MNDNRLDFDADFECLAGGARPIEPPTPKTLRIEAKSLPFWTPGRRGYLAGLLSGLVVIVIAVLVSGCISTDRSGPPPTAFLCATADYARNHVEDCRP